MRLAQEDRIRDQELERQEKMRLEEILAMCAEYERQSSRAAVEKPQRQQQQNRYTCFAVEGESRLRLARARTMDSPASRRSFFFSIYRAAGMHTEYSNLHRRCVNIVVFGLMGICNVLKQ